MSPNQDPFVSTAKFTVCIYSLWTVNTAVYIHSWKLCFMTTPRWRSRVDSPFLPSSPCQAPAEIPGSQTHGRGGYFARHKAGAPILPALLIACRDDVYFGLLARKTNLTPQMIVCSHQSNSAQHFTEMQKKVFESEEALRQCQVTLCDIVTLWHWSI